MHVTIYSIKEDKLKANERISSEVLNELCNRYVVFDYIDVMEPTMAESEVQRLLEYLSENSCEVDEENQSFLIDEKCKQKLLGEEYLFLVDGNIINQKELDMQRWFIGECLNAKV